MQRRHILVWILLIVAVVSIAGYLVYKFREPVTDSDSAVAELQKVTLRLPIPVADTAFAPYYLAIDKGIFAKHGLDVTLEPGSPELNPVKMVSQGTDEFGVIGGPELLLSARSKGAPIVAIGLLHKDSDFVILLTLATSGITRPEQLAGKRVGFFYGHISTDVLHMLFRKLAIEVDEVDIGFDYGQLLTRKIDAQWAFRTTAGLTLPKQGVAVNVISPAAHGISTDGHVLITNESFARDSAETTQAFVDAFIEAIAYSLDHVEESITATVKRDPNFSRTVGERQLAIYNAAIRRNRRIGWLERADLTRAHRQMVAAGLLPEGVDIDRSYSPVFLQDYYDRAGAR